MPTPLFPNRSVKRTVLMEAEAMFTILFPISIAVSESSNDSAMARAFFAFVFPWEALFLRRILFTVENAVSHPEKVAEKATRTIIRMMFIIFTSLKRIYITILS